MERESVISSNLISIGYNETSETLEVEFKGGAVYQYFEVPEDEYNCLMRASSHGIYFAANIKDNYRSKRV